MSERAEQSSGCGGQARVGGSGRREQTGLADGRSGPGGSSRQIIIIKIIVHDNPRRSAGKIVRDRGYNQATRVGCTGVHIVRGGYQRDGSEVHCLPRPLTCAAQSRDKTRSPPADGDDLQDKVQKKYQ